MTQSIFALKRSWQFNEFDKWCEKNHKEPMPLIKKMMRLCLILDEDLTDEHRVTISLNNPIKGY